MGIGEQLEGAVRAYRNGDYVPFMEGFLKVAPKVGPVIPLVLNPMQRDYYAHRTAFDLIPKSRQLGTSTIVMAEFFTDALFQPNMNVVVCAQDDVEGPRLFNKVHIFYDNLPPELEWPALARRSAHELIFEGTDSGLYLVTAGGRAPVRSNTIRRLHGSEVGYWPDQMEQLVFSGMVGAMPVRESRVVFESTANGERGLFYNLVSEAMERPLESLWKLHFYGWHWDAEGRMAIPAGETLEPTPEEAALMERLGLDLEQIAYRRYQHKIHKSLALQECAEDVVSCFLPAGGARFDLGVLEELSLPYCIPPTVERDNGEVRIWRTPLTGASYVIGADPSEGKRTADGKGYGDASAAAIFDARTLEQVAEMEGHWEPIEFARRLAEVGTAYNSAFLIVERNNHGHAVLTALQQIFQYDNLYYHTDSDHSLPRAGFPTTMRTKPLLEANLASLLEERGVVLRSERLYRQLRNYRYLGGGTTGAKAGSHDDLVTVAMLALYARQFQIDATLAPVGARVGEIGQGQQRRVHYGW